MQLSLLILPRCAVAFLEGVIKELLEAKLPRSEQPLLFLRMHVARYLLVQGQTKECKAAIEEGKQSLDSMGDVSAATPLLLLVIQTPRLRSKAHDYTHCRLLCACISDVSQPHSSVLSC